MRRAVSVTAIAISGIALGWLPIAAADGDGYTVLVNGESQTYSRGVACDNISVHGYMDNSLHITIGDPTTDPSVVILLSPDGTIVQSVALGESEGARVSYSRSEGNLVALTKAGNTYTLSGTARGVKNDLTTWVAVPFYVQVTCPQ